ncbi:OmpA family protein [Cupriavidus nantongensis]
MPTTSQATLSVLSKVVAALWLGYASISNAAACSPVRSLDLTFQDESANLSATQALRLGGWIAELKSSFPNYEGFFIAGHVDGTEKGGKRLAQQRAVTVGQFLTDRGFGPDRVHVETPGVSYNRPIDGLAARSVSIDFLPACPNPCCSSPTHKAKDRGALMPGR